MGSSAMLLGDELLMNPPFFDLDYSSSSPEDDQSNFSSSATTLMMSSPSPSSASSSPFDTADFDLDLHHPIKEEPTSASSPLGADPSSPGNLFPLATAAREGEGEEGEESHGGLAYEKYSNSQIFERLLETLNAEHFPGSGETFLLPMDDQNEMEAEAEADFLSTLSSSSADDLAMATVPSQPLQAVQPSLRVSHVPEMKPLAGHNRKATPTLAKMAHKGKGSHHHHHLAAAATLAATAASSPPPSPPSSPRSTSSRSPSPSPSLPVLPNLLSTKPTKVQIGKAITIEISEEDLVNLDIEEIAKIAGTKFTKGEEKELKRLRRKSRNKVSAAQSRNKKKTYLTGLEDRVDAVTSLNIDLKKRLKELERENMLLKNHVNFLSSHVEPSIRATIPLLPPTEDAESSSSSSSTEAADLPASGAAPKAATKQAKSGLTTTSSSLLTAALGKPETGSGKANKTKTTGIYLMLVFLSFGIFFNVVSQNNSQLPLLQVPGALSRHDPALFQQPVAPSPLGGGVPHRSFILRKMHAYEDGDLMMDTIPMLDHLDDPNSTCNDDSFWDAYYETDMAGIDFNERYKHEAVVWKNCPGPIQHLEGSAELLGLEEKLKSIKLSLENQEAIDKVVCSAEMCLVRLEDADLF